MNFSPYTGNVTTGGPSDVRELPGLTIRKASVGPMDNNSYLLTCGSTGAQVLIDAAAEPERLQGLLREGTGGENLELIVTTHRHADHHGALKSLVESTSARTASGADDADGIPVPPSLLLTDDDVISFGDITLDVVALRGHTPGSIALVYQVQDDDATNVPDDQLVHIFTGDSLFPGGVGKTHSSQDFQQLLADVTERVFDRYDNAWVYPGHGKDTTLSAERPALKEWAQRGW